MILTVDIGNTTISLCGLEEMQAYDYSVSFFIKTDTVRSKSAEEYLNEIKYLFAQREISPDVFDGAVLSSVVPGLTEPLKTCVHMLTGREPAVVTSRYITGMNINVQEPEKVGVDRLADAVWAASHYPLPVVTVDMGTATTFNVIDEGNEFLGGVIAPGLDTGLHALSERAAQLYEIELMTPDHVIGKNTVECMLSGAVAGAAAMIDGITARIEGELGKEASLVITGELARYVEPLCTHPHSYDPELLPKGLALLYKRNIKTGASE